MKTHFRRTKEKEWHNYIINMGQSSGKRLIEVLEGGQYEAKAGNVRHHDLGNHYTNELGSF